jgi:MinD-like ATPase involved in chromosome partitioning or flagellar assembly
MARAKRVAIQSYKGGTGKTYFCANLATFLANERQKKVLLIDADWHAGTLARYFFLEETIETMPTFNDFIIWLADTYKEAYTAQASAYDLTDPQFVSLLVDRLEQCVLPTDFDNLDLIGIQGIADPTRKNMGGLPMRFWTRMAIGWLRRVFTDLGKRRQYDIILLDNAPGFSYQTLSTMVIADGSVVVASPDRHNVDETLRVLRTTSGPLKQLLKLQSEASTILPIRTIFNSYVASSRIASTNLGRWKEEFESLAPVIGVFPCDCTIKGGDLMIPNLYQVQPDHPWARELPSVVDNLLGILGIQ